MLLLRPAIGLFSWYAYSAIQRNRVKNTIFPTMQIISELREEYGDAATIPDITSNLPDGDPKSQDSLVCLAGDKSLSVKDCSTLKSTSNGWICGFSDDGKYALFGPESSKISMNLDDLVATKTTMMEIVEDLDQRLAWAKEISSCQAAPEPSTVLGDYHFCYRDYVNHEELLGMMWKRKGIENFLFKPSRASLLSFGEDQTCTLSEKSRMFGIVPVAIDWQGRIDATTNPSSPCIVWDSTCMDLGWAKFGKHFDRPPAAEKLRQDPWVLRIKNDNDNGSESNSDILCVDRKGKGHLVFAKEDCMAPKSRRFGLKRLLPKKEAATV